MTARHRPRPSPTRWPSLANHSALIVAEQFGTLVALHGDRIDLGLGRAPGTDRAVMAAIRRDAGAETVDQFPNQVLELLAYLGVSEPLESGAGSRIVAVLRNEAHPQPWLLGSSDFSARLAGAPDLPFAFAHHFAGGEHTPLAFELYRRSFTPSTVLDEPRAMVAVAALVADDAATARRLRLPQSLLQLRMRRGQPPARVPSQEEADSYPWAVAEDAFVDQRLADQAVGDLDHVRAGVAALVDATGANEVMVVPQGTSVEQRLRTVRELVPANGAEPDMGQSAATSWAASGELSPTSQR